MNLRRGLGYAAPAVMVGLALATFGVHATTSAGKPVSRSLTLCGVGSVGAAQPEGASNQDHPSASTFTATQQPYGTTCTSSNSSAGSDTWKILHSNVDTVTERGTEHGTLLLAASTAAAGFDGHITDFDLPQGDPCSSDGRDVYYQSGTETACPPSSGPVGNVDTHGGASTGQHFWGTYGTLIFQENSNNSPCPVGGATYCIQVDLSGQSN